GRREDESGCNEQTWPNCRGGLGTPRCSSLQLLGNALQPSARCAGRTRGGMRCAVAVERFPKELAVALDGQAAVAATIGDDQPNVAKQDMEPDGQANRGDPAPGIAAIERMEDVHAVF